MDPKAVAQLMDMGASRPAALSALRASKGDVNEAAIVVFDPIHANATATEPDHEPSDGIQQDGSSQHSIDEDDDDHYSGSEAGNMHDDIDFFGAEHEEAGADPFAQISFKKDRRETMVEIEEPSEKVEISVGDACEPAWIMPQGEWMKGCAAGNEQSVSSLSSPNSILVLTTHVLFFKVSVPNL